MKKLRERGGIYKRESKPDKRSDRNANLGIPHEVLQALHPPHGCAARTLGLLSRAKLGGPKALTLSPSLQFAGVEGLGFSGNPRSLLDDPQLKPQS